MRKIFESENVNLIDYLRERSEIKGKDDLRAFVSSHSFELEISIVELLNKDFVSGFYDAFEDGELLVEHLCFDGLTVILKQHIDPEYLFNQTNIKDRLNIGCLVHYELDIVNNLIDSYFNNCPFNYQKRTGNLYLGAYPHKIEKRNNFIVVKNPIVNDPSTIHKTNESIFKVIVALSKDEETIQLEKTSA